MVAKNPARMPSEIDRNKRKAKTSLTQSTAASIEEGQGTILLNKKLATQQRDMIAANQAALQELLAKAETQPDATKATVMTEARADNQQVMDQCKLVPIFQQPPPTTTPFRGATSPSNALRQTPTPHYLYPGPQST